MANLAYFHYGTEPGATSDRVLYWAYYPMHRHGGRYGMHWSDRRDPVLPHH
ncbi:MAG TPA: hypothetical protein VEC99_05960 [Clostridia bacterium]|nr:hypothetical protein [Clostridia bacterium]